MRSSEKELYREIVEMFLKEIKEASSKPEGMVQCSPRERAVACYKELLQATTIRVNTN